MDSWLAFFKTGAPLAGLAAIASILAFLLRDRKENFLINFKKFDLKKIIHALWPDLIFIACLILGLIVLYRSLARIQETKHEILTISVPGGDTYAVIGVQGEIKVYSDSIPFKIMIQGQFSVSQLKNIENHYKGFTSCLDSNNFIPLYIWVTERSKSGINNYWWPHKSAINLKSNGTYEAFCLLGGSENFNTAEDGELFGIKVCIPQDPCEEVKTDGSFYPKIQPDPLFISDELPIKTMRSDQWKKQHNPQYQILR